jgi:hypothetical protein
VLLDLIREEMETDNEIPTRIPFGLLHTRQKASTGRYGRYVNFYHCFLFDSVARNRPLTARLVS